MIEYEDTPVEVNQYGFRWGIVDVIRQTFFHPTGHRCVGIDAGKHRVTVYVSRTGRSVRVWKDGKELK